MVSFSKTVLGTFLLLNLSFELGYSRLGSSHSSRSIRHRNLEEETIDDDTDNNTLDSSNSTALLGSSGLENSDDDSWKYGIHYDNDGHVKCGKPFGAQITIDSWFTNEESKKQVMGCDGEDWMDCCYNCANYLRKFSGLDKGWKCEETKKQGVYIKGTADPDPNPPNPNPSSSSSLCKGGNVEMNSVADSIWEHQTSHPSCTGEYKTEGFSQCAGDPTSISLDMSKVDDKQGCYLYNSEQKLSWEFQPGTEITFDAEWENCEEVWMAPLWLTPTKWKPPQGLSGEIDLIETCKGHHGETLSTSIICSQHEDEQCLDKEWGSTSGDGGHFVGKIDQDGTWTMEKCDLKDTSKCELISRYPKYLTTNTGSKENMKFYFVSDLYNGGAGDDGWDGCGTLNKNTQCKYTVANIKVSSN